MSNIAVVTGGNRGMGFAVCNDLVKRGVPTLLCGRDFNAATTAAEDINKQNNKELATGIQMDVSNLESLRQGIRDIEKVCKERGVGVEILVNNAGIYEDNWNKASFDAHMKTNFIGALELAEGLLPIMTRGGRVVNVSSGYGSFSEVPPQYAKRIDEAQSVEALRALEFDSSVKSGFVTAYKVSKCAMNKATRLLAGRSDFLAKDVAVSCCCPGWVATRMGGSCASRTVDQGAASILWLVNHAKPMPNGVFVRDGQVKPW